MTPEIKQLIEPILIRFGVTFEDMLGHCRKRKYTEPRFLCWSAIRMKYPEISLTKIGTIFGRDHTTIMNGVIQAEQVLFYRKDYELDYYFNNIKKTEFKMEDFYFSVTHLTQ